MKVINKNTGETKEAGESLFGTIFQMGILETPRQRKMKITSSNHKTIEELIKDVSEQLKEPIGESITEAIFFHPATGEVELVIE